MAGIQRTDSPQPRVLLVGASISGELRTAIDAIRTRVTVISRATIAEALDWLREPSSAIEAVFLLAARPGLFTVEQIEQLHRAAPLARLVAVLGTWCEGELRTGKPWPGVLRVPWHHLDAVVSRWLTDRSATSAWHLPRTATPADQLLFESHPARANSPQRLIGIQAAQLADFEALADALECAGYASVWWRAPARLHATRPAAIVWDFVHFGPQERALFERHRPAAEIPCIALLGFPRLEHIRHLEAAGVCACLGKPFHTRDLVELVGRYVSNRAVSSTNTRMGVAKRT